MEHDFPTASEPVRIADKSVPMPDARDCSSSLLADASRPDNAAGRSGDASNVVSATKSGETTHPSDTARISEALEPLVLCRTEFQFSALDARETPAKDLPAIWLDTKSVDAFRLEPQDIASLKPYPEIATAPEVRKIPSLDLDLNSAIAAIRSNPTDYDSIARRDSEAIRKFESFTSPTNDTVSGLLGLARKFGIMPPPPTATFGEEIGDELNGTRKPGDGMPLQRFPMKRGFTVGGSTNLIANDNYSFDVGANVSMRKIPDELKQLYGGKALEGRVEFKWKF